MAGLRVHRGEVVGKAVWAPIIDQDTHEALVATLRARGNGGTQPTLQRWCNQLLFCGHCGRPMSGSYVSPKRPYRYWCNPRRAGGCGRMAINGPKVEAELERQVLEYLTRPDVVERLSAATSREGAERARADLAEDEAQLRTLSRMWAEKQITLDEYAEARKIIQQRIEGARAAMVAAVPERVRRVLAADDIAAAWKDLPPEGRREVARALLEANGMVGWTVAPADLTKRRAFDPSRLTLRPLD